MLCHRGCGLLITYTNKKGLGCCSKIAQHCPTVKKKIGERSGNTRRLTPVRRTEEQKKNQSAVIKKQHADGKRNKTETIEKIRQGNIKTKQTQTIVPWNKGLTINDPRVAAYVTKQKGVSRSKRIKNIESNDPVYNDIKKYRNRIAVRTKQTYEMYKQVINPNNLPLGKAGIDGAYHVDHIFSVREGFTYSVPIELMAAIDNLQIVSWRENISKYSRSNLSLTSESIKKYLKENLCDTY
jgi:hypothetical protein